ncbi:metallophosphoesterase [uncultured Cellulomonas sp.]|uniref:metallophosphoesterase n=1 Tax=uncultured Cellulomonas sp. TaxID=189682 RepID=UPI00260FB680|nr:metallophosphoesterase [uncultured Cellulomonas sp.]
MRVVRRVAGALAVVVALLLVYGVAIEPRLVLDDRRYTAPVPGLPAAWAGAEVAVFSDLQTGMWWANAGMVERIVQRVVEQRPDVVLIPGDFLYSTSPPVAEQVDTVMDQLAPLVESGIPTYAVLGNHDYAAGGAEEMATALQAAGIPVLQNEAVVLDAPGGDGAGGADGADGPPLHLIGLAATRPGLTDVDAAVSGVPDDAPRLVMMHNPTPFADMPAGTAPLAVAGHTHCGQIALPATPRWSYLGLTEEEEVVADGWAPKGYGAAGNSLFVTCGVGFSVVPVRINAAPQLVVFTLEGA